MLSIKADQESRSDDVKYMILFSVQQARQNGFTSLAVFLKVPCHAFLVITHPLVYYVAFYACKRSAKSQTLKVHPVVSKTLTQKRPVYAAPERLVGDFSFSIFSFLVIVT